MTLRFPPQGLIPSSITSAQLPTDTAYIDVAQHYTAQPTFSGGAVFDTLGVFFRNTIPHFSNPGVTANYVLITSAIAADRQITLPLLTANDSFAFQNDTETLTNKTLDSTTNFSGTAATATAGAATLPANPVGFVTVNVGGTARKIPHYAV